MCSFSDNSVTRFAWRHFAGYLRRSIRAPPDECRISTNAIPGASGIASKNAVKAFIPPADAPIPTAKIRYPSFRHPALFRPFVLPNQRVSSSSAPCPSPPLSVLILVIVTCTPFRGLFLPIATGRSRHRRSASDGVISTVPSTQARLLECTLANKQTDLEGLICQLLRRN